MTENQRNLIENLDNMKLGLDDSFRFHCRQCGKCCTHREDIILNPRDLFRAAKELGITTIRFLMTYCEMYIGCDSRMPIVRLKPAGEDRHCPLLENHHCKIHNAKPGICAMYPLGRGIAHPADAPEDEIDKAETFYLLQNVNCGSRAKSHTVREWLASFDLETDDQFFLLWQKNIIILSRKVVELEKGADEKAMRAIWTFIGNMLYSGYKMDQDFMEQFQERITKLNEALDRFSVEEGGSNDA